MKQKDIISYAYDFLSLLFEKEDIDGINQVILFGSIAKNEFDNKSDVDIFIDTKKDLARNINSAQRSFHTKIERIWRPKGIELPIKVIVGNLNKDKWKDLKKEIISTGIVLYGRYKELPDGLENYAVFTYSLEKLSRKVMMKLHRKLYGYKIEKGKKEYHMKGLLEELDGSRLGTHTIILRVKDSSKIKNLFGMLKVNYSIKEIFI